MQINTIVMSGNASDDAVLTTLPGTSTIKATFLLLQTEHYKHKGEAKVKTHSIQVECWGAIAEMAGKWVGKGKSVCVQGQLETQSWKDKETGNWRNKNVIKATHIDLLGPKKPNGKSEADSQVEGEF